MIEIKCLHCLDSNRFNQTTWINDIQLLAWLINNAAVSGSFADHTCPRLECFSLSDIHKPELGNITTNSFTIPAGSAPSSPLVPPVPSNTMVWLGRGSPYWEAFEIFENGPSGVVDSRKSDSLDQPWSCESNVEVRENRKVTNTDIDFGSSWLGSSQEAPTHGKWCLPCSNEYF